MGKICRLNLIRVRERMAKEKYIGWRSLWYHFLGLLRINLHWRSSAWIERDVTHARWLIVYNVVFGDFVQYLSEVWQSSTFTMFITVLFVHGVEYVTLDRECTLYYTDLLGFLPTAIGTCPMGLVAAERRLTHLVTNQWFFSPSKPLHNKLCLHKYLINKQDNK